MQYLYCRFFKSILPSILWIDMYLACSHCDLWAILSPVSLVLFPGGRVQLAICAESDVNLSVNTVYSIVGFQVTLYVTIQQA